MKPTASDDRRSDLLRVLRRRAWIVVVLAVVCAGAAYGVASNEQKQYTATASLLFQQQQLGQQVFGYSVTPQVTDPGVAQATDIALASAPLVGKTAAARLGMSPADVARDVAVTAAGSSQVMSVAATTTSPALAARLANTYAQTVVDVRRATQQHLVQQAATQVRGQLNRLLRTSPNSPQVRQVQSRLSQLTVLAAVQTGDVQISNPASVPTAASAPRTKRDVGLGGLLGIVLGLVLVFLLERIDRRLRDEDDMAEIYGMPVLAHVPRSRTLVSTASAKPPIPDPAAAEAFRILRARLRYFNVDRKLQTLLITSAVPQEGKSTVAWQLAWAAASIAPDEPVLLIEADLRRPSVAGATGLAPAPGLSDALTQLDDWRDAVQTISTGPGDAGVLHVLTAGGPPPNPTELIESDKLRSLLAAARGEYALVVVDAPPALLVSDALALVPQVDGVVVVSRVNHTHRDAAVGLRTTLAETHAPVLGLVVNGVPSVGGRYGYGPYDSQTGRPAARPARSLTSS